MARGCFAEFALPDICFGLFLEKGSVGFPCAITHFRGQATVEGAFLIPVMLLVLMLLIQPGILLYDRMVMNAAASEGCRLIATQGSQDSPDAYLGYVKRRLGSVPQQENFHVHEAGCSWVVEFVGNENGAEVCVSIQNQVKPLPFFDFGAKALGLVNEGGNFEQQVSVSTTSKSAWVAECKRGLDPKGWVESSGSTAERGEQ